MVKKMGVMETLGNVLFLLGVIFFIFVKVSGLEHKELSIEDPKLCSPITKRKVRYESLMVNQGWSINQHSVTWNIPNLCKFEVQSTYSKGGIVAVIQKLNLRKNADTGECIDYIQFRAKKGSISRRHCGLLDARIVMNYYMDSDDISYSMADANTFMDVDGELDVIIFIAKEPLSYTERTEFLIVFTSYKNCSEPHHNKHITLLECVQNFKSICINKDYFGDGHINCPYYGCADEMGCFEPPKSEPKGAVAKRVIIGSISTFGIIFGVFIILIWAFKKHKLFCWAEDFAHPTPTPENNRNSRVMEMNEQTGARLAETVTPEVQASAPVLEEDKDLPPSYDSLFPNPRETMQRLQQSKNKLLAILKEFKLDECFPTYLTDYTGYVNHEGISLIGDDDILRLEKFARNILPSLLTEEEKINFYGIFIKNIPVFCIVDGDTKLLQILIKNCKLFKEQKTKTEKKVNPRVNQSRRGKKRNISETLSNENFEENLVETDKSSLPGGENDERAKDHIRLIIKSYQEKLISNLKEEDKSYFLKNRSTDDIDVEIKNDIAYVTCSICKFKSKAYCEIDKERKNKRKWVFSNVNRHFRTHFKNESTFTSSKKTEKNPDLKITSYFKSFKNNKSLEDRETRTSSQDVPSTSQVQPVINILSTIETDLPLSGEIEGKINDEIDLTEIDNLDQEFSASQIITGTAYDSTAITPLQICNVNPTGTRSRLEKKYISRQLSFDSSQTKITDFYEICEEIKVQIIANPLVSKELTTSANIFSANRDIDFTSDLTTDIRTSITSSSFFELIKAAVAKNSSQNSAANRFTDDLKKLCLYLFLTSGRLAYQTLVANVPKGLPSISTLSRSLSENYEKFAEGELAFCKLKQYLENRNYPLHVFISEDQTAIVKRPRYDQSTNQLVGYVLANSEKTGFPAGNQNEINSAADIRKITENGELAKNAYVFMAQPLAENSAAFCLTIFGSNNCFNTEDVLLRWKHIEDEARTHNIIVEGFASDGDTRCLKAMKKMAELPTCNKQEALYSPYFQAEFTINTSVVIQDTVHIGTKIKTRLLNPKVVLKLGDYEVSKDHLENIIKNVSKDKHLLCPSYLNNMDKMNFEAIDKLSATCVTDLLLKNDESKATGQLLILTRYILDTFLDKSLSVIERVYRIWYSTFFLRLWRAWIKDHKEYSLSKNWITLNTYTCVELNAHGLLILIEKHREHPERFLPWLFSSQPCEKFFRQTRSMTSTLSTVVNFDILDLLRRRHRIEAIDRIISNSGDTFTFPREKSKRLGGNLKNNDIHFPTTEEIRHVISEARCKVIKDCKTLGINLLETACETALDEVSIPQLDSSKDNSHEINIPETSNHTANDEELEMEGETPHQSEILVEANEEDQTDIEKENHIFENLTELNVKDFSGIKTETDRSVLRIKIKEKEMVVKKTTLCWLFFNRKGHLSSDRILRCKNMAGSLNAKKINMKSKVSKRNLGKKIERRTQDRSRSIPDSDSSLSDNYSVQSEYENESFSEDDPEEQNFPCNGKILSKIDINQEAYYAVCYKSWYIGRVVKLIDSETSEIKFLKLEVDKYFWPKQEDKQIVKNTFIFYGPISLLGIGPFELKRSDKLSIEKAFKITKKNLKDLL